MEKKIFLFVIPESGDPNWSMEFIAVIASKIDRRTKFWKRNSKYLKSFELSHLWEITNQLKCKVLNKNISYFYDKNLSEGYKIICPDGKTGRMISIKIKENKK